MPDPTAPNPAGTAAIFVGGPSRSGTMMLSGILSRHYEIGIAAETHYFDDLRPRLGQTLVADLPEAEQTRLIDYFRALSHRAYGRQGEPEAGWLTRDALLTEAARHGGNADAVFRAFCILSAAREGGAPAIWGEKTPRNVFRAKEILDAFPGARLIFMVRDPRGCVVSYRDWTQKKIDDAKLNQDAAFMAAYGEELLRKARSYNIVIATLMWRAAINAAIDAVDRLGADRVRVMRYEDIVANPSAEIEALCGWLGVTFSPDMLGVSLANSSYGSVAGAGVTTKPMDRWRERLSLREIRVVQTVAGRSLTRLGYDPVPGAGGPLDIVAAYAATPFAIVRAATANRARIANLPSYAWRRLRAVLR